LLLLPPRFSAVRVSAAKAAKARRGGSSVLQVLGRPRLVRGFSECDGCATLVETLFDAWMEALPRVALKPGDRGATYDYDEELRGTVESICDTAPYRHFSVDAAELCREAIQAHADDIARAFGARPLSPAISKQNGDLLLVKQDVCLNVVRACESDELFPARANEQEPSACEACAEVVADIEHDFRRSRDFTAGRGGPGGGGGSDGFALRAAKVLADVCRAIPMRHAAPHRLSELCETVVDEQEEALVAAVAARARAETCKRNVGFSCAAEVGRSLPLVSTVCVDMTGMCSTRHPIIRRSTAEAADELLEAELAAIGSAGGRRAAGGGAIGMGKEEL
jgi:hypothetical protein